VAVVLLAAVSSREEIIGLVERGDNRRRRSEGWRASSE
jgi:hypothetical protein